MQDIAWRDKENTHTQFYTRVEDFAYVFSHQYLINSKWVKIRVLKHHQEQISVAWPARRDEMNEIDMMR
jgi:hypothetical protein